jgi:hypothetical protein
VALATTGALGLASGSGAPSAAGALVIAQFPARVALPPTVSGGTLRSGFGEGGRIVLVSPSGRVTPLTTAFESAADPEVSFDGKSILFAARRTAGDSWCVYEMRADGTGVRQLTCGAAGARQPVYQSTIYTITATSVEPWVQIAFVGRNPGERNEAGSGPNTSLWTCRTDGSSLRRITFNLSNDMDPVVLPDGRMLYASWQRHPGSRGPDGRVPLLGLNQDGTDAQIYAGDEGLRVKQMPAPTAGGRVVFVESDAVEPDGGGRLASVSARRPLHSYRSLSAAPDGHFHSPAPLPEGGLLVSWRPAGGRATYAVYRYDPDSGAREKLFDNPELGVGAGEARGAAPDARRALERRARRRPRGQAVCRRRAHPTSARLPGMRLGPQGRRGRAGVGIEARGPPAPGDRPPRGRRLLSGPGPGEHAARAAAPGPGRPGDPQLRVALGEKPCGAGLRGLPRRSGADAAQSLCEGVRRTGTGAEPAAGEAPERRLRGGSTADHRSEVPDLPR